MSPLIRTAVLLLMAGLASHVQATPLSFTDALELAERKSPRLAANDAMIAAARSAAIPAGAMPDPKIVAGLDNFPVSGPEAGRLQADFMTMEKIGVMQEVPNADKRHAYQAVAAAKTDIAFAERKVERLAVRRNAALAWIDLYFVQRKEALFTELDQENKLLTQVVQAQIASGRALAVDAIAARQEAAQLADRRDDLARDLAQADSRLKQLVGVAIVDGLVGNPPTFEIDAQHLRGHLHHHPELLAFAAKTREAEAEVMEAQSMKKSDWGVELVFQRRAPQFGDMVSIQFTFDLPVSPATRQEPLIAARQHELTRIDAERDDMLRDHTSELESMLAEHAALSRQLERAQHIALPLVEQKVSLQIASYQAGKGELATVLGARRERIDQRLRIIELEAAQTRAITRLHYAYGEDWQ